MDSKSGKGCVQLRSGRLLAAKIDDLGKDLVVNADVRGFKGIAQSFDERENRLLSLLRELGMSGRLAQEIHCLSNKRGIPRRRFVRQPVLNLFDAHCRRRTKLPAAPQDSVHGGGGT